MIRVWRNLQRLRWVAFRAESGTDESGHGHGHGQVTVIRGADTVRIHEKGRFTTGMAGKSACYRNVYRWQWHDQCLSLAHERFGADAAVHLADLVPSDDGMLVAAQPHLCGRDQYKLRVWPADDAVHLEWHILGPRKHTKLRTVYSAAAPDVRSFR